MQLKKEFLISYEEETKGLLENISTQDKIIQDLNKNMKSLKKLSNELSKSARVTFRKDEGPEREKIRAGGRLDRG